MVITINCDLGSVFYNTDKIIFNCCTTTPTQVWRGTTQVSYHPVLWFLCPVLFKFNSTAQLDKVLLTELLSSEEIRKHSNPLQRSDLQITNYLTCCSAYIRSVTRIHSPTHRYTGSHPSDCHPQSTVKFKSSCLPCLCVAGNEIRTMNKLPGRLIVSVAVK